MPALPTVIRKVAVIGAGPAGRGFALRCIRAGLHVILEDVLPSKLRLATSVLAEQQLQNARELFQLASTVEEAVRDADLAIDFVPDELESKLEIFSMVDRMAPPRTLLCTPTARLSLTDLASCTYRPDRCVALRGDLESNHVDAIRGRLTGPDAIELTSKWLHQLGYNERWVEDVEEPMLVKNARNLP